MIQNMKSSFKPCVGDLIVWHNQHLVAFVELVDGGMMRLVEFRDDMIWKEWYDIIEFGKCMDDMNIAHLSAT